MKNYKDLEIYQLAYSLALEVHKMTMISDIHYPDQPLKQLMDQYEMLGGKINKFIQYVEENWIVRT